MTRTGSRCPVWRCLEFGSLEPGEPVLGVWDSEPGEPVLGVWRLGAGLGARRKSEHPSQSSNA